MLWRCIGGVQEQLVDALLRQRWVPAHAWVPSHVPRVQNHLHVMFKLVADIWVSFLLLRSQVK